MTTVTTTTMSFIWCYVTDRCQLECRHCATSSGPTGTHGSMTSHDWTRVLDEASRMGVRKVQFVGGEPTLYPALPELITYALGLALDVEVFSNMVHVTDELWDLFTQPGVSLATSYYSDDPAEHAAITGRPSHARTRANIIKAQALHIPLRAGLIDFGTNQRVSQARAELVDLGIPSIGCDQVRELGRGAADQKGHAAQLCGRCGGGVAAIGPDGRVTPCLFSKWATVGDVRQESLSDICGRMPGTRTTLSEQGMPTVVAGACNPESTGENCWPYNCNPRG